MVLYKVTYKDDNSKGLEVQETEFFQPYTGKNQTPTTWEPKQREKATGPGCYLIKSKKTGKILYAGQSTYNVQKTCYRHFQSWNDPTQERFTYKQDTAYEVKFYFMKKENVYMFEQYLMKKKEPKDGQLKLIEETIDWKVKTYEKQRPTEEKAPF